ncbi:MAG TPA: DegT/DnrJ/EryC1/StrS family aminotransferase [Nitrospirae bacterium]|nr:dTDP-3-amino-3,6-dideoxy-alpha-D-galactopyranose transaminase [bacterium BMS3Abin10]GBE39671.1 dTDP-3-amino-3,6-dideoxy-alpha-D-galactopyranose transaminase [bacterium BMS3Bbin08]HDH51146.1 DegT/DnrJ/EryC1/StrS family aminotransferase [Nitrospirota bacterium]HDK41438.1 DegT/DnrJ/EryC1/StrS family aminotransferase [Nitrospirota bacterium]HDK82290.1 DegT/DnrJ/EryC1/StrS family aminotransferase [Nitrospirota bacterium]
MPIQQRKENKTEQETPPVQMLDLRAQYESLRQEIDAVLSEILSSGHFVLGRHVESLEREVAEYHGVKYAVGLASCTDALHLSLRALGIKEGDEVITTPFTFIAAAEAIAYVGATPVFTDIDPKTLNIDPSGIKKRVTARTKAIIPVHLFGQPADMDEIMDIARQHGLKVVEDCAQAFGAKYKNRHVAGIGDAGCYSFYPSKNLGGYGDGGMMITNDPEIFKKVRLLRNHGTTGPYKHSFIGYNSRLDEIQAAILRIKLKHIDTYNQNRRTLAELYTSIIGNSVQCPVEMPDRSHVFHQYTIRSPQREKIRESLKKSSISSVVYYPVPLHLQEAFKNLGYRKGDLVESETAAREVLSLPVYPELDPEKVRFIAEAVVKALNE